MPVWPCTITRRGALYDHEHVDPVDDDLRRGRPRTGWPVLDAGAGLCAAPGADRLRQLGCVVRALRRPGRRARHRGLPRRPGRPAPEHFVPEGPGVKGRQEPAPLGHPNRRWAERYPVGGALAEGGGAGAWPGSSRRYGPAAARPPRPAGSLRDGRPRGQRVLRTVGLLDRGWAVAPLGVALDGGAESSPAPAASYHPATASHSTAVVPTIGESFSNVAPPADGDRLAVA